MSSETKYPKVISLAIENPCYYTLVKQNAELIAKSMGFNDDHIYDIGLIVDEAFVNAVEHGASKFKISVRVDFAIYKDRLEITVEDDGCGFDLDVTQVPEHLCSLQSTRGRGLGLMRLLTDEFEVTTAKGAGTRVHMTKYIDSRAIEVNQG
jgi:anti-sigma regulatory factor (Ser/Thr protein kinase)